MEWEPERFQGVMYADYLQSDQIYNNNYRFKFVKPLNLEKKGVRYNQQNITGIN